VEHYELPGILEAGLKPPLKPAGRVGLPFEQSQHNAWLSPHCDSQYSAGPAEETPLEEFLRAPCSAIAVSLAEASIQPLEVSMDSGPPVDKQEVVLRPPKGLADSAVRHIW
jgi:hypothetical protein